MRYLQKILAGLRRFARTGLRFLLEEVGSDLLASRRARRNVLRRIEEGNKLYSQQIEALRGMVDGLTVDDLHRYANLEADRRKSIDNKAKTYFAAMTIAFTVLFAGLNFLNTALSGRWVTAAVVLLIAGVVYFFLGGLNAFEGLTITRFYSPSPEDESGLAVGARKLNLLWCLKQNEMYTTLQTNALSVAHKSIRNGVIVLAALTLLLAGRMLLGSATQLPPGPQGVFQKSSLNWHFTPDCR